MASQRLTDIGSATGVTTTDYIHIVNPNDTTQDPAGSSFKATLQQVVDLVNGNLTVSIENGLPKSFPSLTSTVVGGTPPYTYTWSISQGPFDGFIFSGETTQSSVNLISMSASSYSVGRYQPINNDSITNNGRSIGSVNVKLTVEDVNGYKASTQHIYLGETCYPVYTHYIDPLVLPSVNCTPQPNENIQIVDLPSVDVDFMDDIRRVPTCYELDNLGCGFDPEDYNNTYRASRNQLVANTNNNLLSFISNIWDRNITDLNYNFDPSPLKIKETAPVLTWFKGPMTVVNYPMGKSLNFYSGWTASNLTISGYTVESRMVGYKDSVLTQFYDTKNLPKVRTLAQLNAIIGNAGDTIYVDETSLSYAWDGISQIWSSNLYDALFDECIVYKLANRNFVFSTKTQLILAMKSFVWSNGYLPSHRIKKDLF